MHLRRLSLELTFDEMRELFIHLGLKSTQWKNLQINKKVENVIFESLIKWRDSSESGTFNDLKKAMEHMELSVHKICKVFNALFCKTIFIIILHNYQPLRNFRDCTKLICVTQFLVTLSYLQYKNSYTNL